MAKKNVSATIKNDNEFYKLIKVTLILIICFGIFYVVTYFVTKNNANITGNGSTQEELATIQYDKIVLGDIKNQNRSEYYVLLDKMDSNDYNLYQIYMNMYLTKENALKIFQVDMNDVFNRDYYADETNLNLEDMSKFRIKKATLLKIKNGEIISHFEGKDQIVKEFKSIIK